MEQVVTQLQQAVSILKAQVDDQTGFAEAVRAINNLATRQVRKDTPSLIDVKGLGCPKKFSDRDEDFQQWSKKTEALFLGVIKESEMMLVWSAEQAAEITTELIDLEFLPTSTNVERGVRTLEFVLQQIHTALMALTGYHSNDIVANPRKNPLEGGEDCRNDVIRRLEEEHETFCGRSFLLDGALFWKFKRGSNDGNPTCRT